MGSAKKVPAAAAVLAIEKALNLRAAGESAKAAEASAVGAGKAAKAKEHSSGKREALEALALQLDPSRPTGESAAALESNATLSSADLAARKTILERVADLLGGTRVLQRHLKDPLDAHEMLLEGLPGKALSTFVDNLMIQKAATFEKAMGMSLRTFQRHKDAPSKPLSQEQSGQIWKFAEILTKATAVLGSQEEAEKWLDRPAIGLNQRRPIDLLATPAGVELVEDFLERLEYGVYV